jgi:uncharacterized protein (TIRG00374 family)
LAAALFQASYYVAYSGLYQAAFDTVEVKSRVRDLLPITFGSIFVNVVAPSGGASGAALFVDDAVRRGQSAARAAAGTILVLAADLAAFSLVLLVGLGYLFLQHNLQAYELAASLVLLAMVAGLTGVLLLGLWQPARLLRLLGGLQQAANWLAGRLRRPPLLAPDWATRNAGEFSQAAVAIAAFPGRLARTLGLALAAHAANLLSLYALFLAFRHPIQFGPLVAGYAVGILFMIVSPIPMGIGVVEAIMPLVYISLGAPSEAATVVTLAFRGLSFWLPFVAGFLLLRRMKAFDATAYVGARAKKRGPRFAITLALLPLLLCILVSIGLFVAARWPQRLPGYASQVGLRLKFEQVASPGFDAAGRARLADSAWSMRYFQPDGAAAGHVYVGTDNNIVGLVMAGLRTRKAALPVQPPQIRRYRPDLGSQLWEVTLDYADHEQPPYLNEGFRSMGVYKARTDGRTYLYAGTMAAHNPGVWRSASGEPGSWEQVFTFPDEPESRIGSIRGMIAHDDGLLYMSTTRSGDILPGGVGQIWATDGLAFTWVITDGFGNPNNDGISSLVSFNGCLYAGTYNPATGYEVWKLRCMPDLQAPAQPVIRGGGGQPHNEAVMSMHVFKGRLYVGTGIPLGFNPITRHGPRGCDLIRINPDDSWEMIVGPPRDHPLSGYRAGFGWYLNAYCWYMNEHAGYLYLGTWDMSRTIAFLGEDVESVAPVFRPLLDELVVRPQDWGSPVGGDLYQTADGVHWEPVFLDGLGNPDNHGIRTLEPTPMGFFVGTENPFTRLEVWRLGDE